MASIFDKVSEVKNSLVSKAAPGEGGSASGSAYKVAKETKESKKATNTSGPTEIAKMSATRLTTGLLAPETVDASKTVAADYYRRGRIKTPREGESGRTLGVEYEYAPRTLTDGEVEPASIRMIGKASTGSKTKAVDLIPPFSKFLLEGYQEGHMERHQIVETFGEFYAFFFGERPAIYTFSGTLLNTPDINWKEDFMFYYENFLRGTKCVEYQAKLLLTYNLSQVEGFLLGVNTQSQAANDKGVAVSFQFLVIDRKSMRLSVDFGITEANGRFNEDRSIMNLLTKGSSDPAVSDSYKQASAVMKGTLPPATTAMVSPTELDRLKGTIPGLSTITSSGKVSLA